MKACNFEGAIAIGAPRDWDIDRMRDRCGTIFVHQSIHPVTKISTLYSLYLPTPEDIEAINKGGGIRLGFPGRDVNQHPVFQLGVIGPGLMKRIAPVPMWDLGGVIDE